MSIMALESTAQGLSLDPLVVLMNRKGPRVPARQLSFTLAGTC